MEEFNRVDEGSRESRLSNPGGIPVGACSDCQRDVVGWLAGDPADGFLCSACDRPLRQVAWMAEEELAELGYDVWDPLARGCGGGCAKGGCGTRR